MALPNPINLWHDARAVARAHWYLREATEVGSRVRLWGHPIVSNQGTMRIGSRVRLVSTVATLELVVASGGTMEIGESVFLNYGCSIGATIGGRSRPG